MPRIRDLLFLLVALTTSGSGLAATLFEQSAVLDITLEGPLSSVTGDTQKRRERAFSLVVDGQRLDVAVRLRGKSRIEHCSFPPLRLNFASDSVEGSRFAGQDKLKLVTHCKSRAEYEQNLLEEYAAYRILNVLTDISFRVQLVRITYVDTDSAGAEPLTRFAFLIESDENLAHRIDGKPLEVKNVTRSMLEPNHAALIYVFQYLIANTDWSLVRHFEEKDCCHNGKLFSAGDVKHYVPYDFDMSGLVNARYAKPQPGLRLRSVRVRRYRGYCTEPEALRDALRSVVARRAEILGVIAELPGLSDEDRGKTLRFLDAFFEKAADERKLLRQFERRCL